ncbi:helix-turn-helix domain-containing protein [Nocardioides sp. B-3]|uniref:helix-turn-helix domain-containing protein n=1 Tax=Nocardioides sp. B-3 TaxID=2895565 RepID=UPI003FA5E180
MDYWGEPRRAAHALGIHPNTVRYRLTRLAERWPVDLTDPAQRPALRPEIAGKQAGH